MVDVSLFHFPTSISFGENSSKEIGNEICQNKYQKILLVADKGVCVQSFFLDMKKSLDHVCDVEVFNEFSPNPLSSEIDHFVESKSKNLPNLIIGLG